MKIVIFIISIYAFIQTTVTGYLEYSKNNNKIAGIVIYLLAIFILIVPNIMVQLR